MGARLLEDIPMYQVYIKEVLGGIRLVGTHTNIVLACAQANELELRTGKDHLGTLLVTVRA